MTLSAPRPVKTPPTELASRQPWAVLSNSGTAARCGERLRDRLGPAGPHAVARHTLRAQCAAML
jgi:hypothetical protein